MKAWHGSEDRDAVIPALAVLPPMQRAVLILRYLDDLPVREVARLVGKSEAAVESLLARGKQAFRRHMDGVDDD